jgi:hypothetical protein
MEKLSDCIEGLGLQDALGEQEVMITLRLTPFEDAEVTGAVQEAVTADGGLPNHLHIVLGDFFIRAQVNGMLVTQNDVTRSLRKLRGIYYPPQEGMGIQQDSHRFSNSSNG